MIEKIIKSRRERKDFIILLSFLACLGLSGVGYATENLFLFILGILASVGSFVYIISRIYEKTIITILIVAILLILFSYPSNATIISYDFEGDTIGQNPLNWIINESTNTNVQVYDESGNKKCFLDDNNGGHFEYCSMLKYFSTTIVKDDISWSFDIKVTEDSDHTIFKAILGGGVEEITIRIINSTEAERSIYISSYGEDTYHFINNYEIGSWKTITVNIYNLNYSYSATDGIYTVWGELNPSYSGVNWTMFVTDSMDSSTTDYDTINTSIDNVMVRWNEFPSNPPEIQTLAATDIGGTSAKLWGNLTSKGDATNVTVGFQIGTFPGDYDETIIVSNDASLGKFSYLKEDLNPSTNYVYRAFATYKDGTVYGNDVSFSTKNIHPPVASFEYSLNGKTVTVNASSSYDSDGTIVLYEWDWESDGIYDNSSTSPVFSHTYKKAGTYTITLRVTDNDGATDTATSDEGGGGIIIKTNTWKLPFTWFEMILLSMIGLIGVSLSAFFMKKESIRALGYAPAAGAMLVTIFMVAGVFMWHAKLAWYWIAGDATLILFILYVVFRVVFIKNRKKAKTIFGVKRVKKNHRKKKVRG